MSEQRNLNLSDQDPLIPGRTGNTQLDSILKEIANEPLVCNAEEAFEIIASSPSSNIALKNGWSSKALIIGTVLIVGIAGVLWNNSTKKITNSNNTTDGIYGLDTSEETTTSAIPETTASSVTNDGNTIVDINTKISPELTSNLNTSDSKAASVKSEKSSTINNNNKVGSQDIKKNNNNSHDNTSSSKPKTTVTQRFFVDGSAMVALEFEGKPAIITINPRGIEKLTIGNEIIQAVEYPKYESVAVEAFQRAKIEPLSGPTHDANSATDIPAIMIKTLINKGLIKESVGFEFVLTAANASLNDKVLSEDIQLDLLRVLKNASGKELPKNGRIRIKR